MIIFLNPKSQNLSKNFKKLKIPKLYSKFQRKDD